MTEPRWAEWARYIAPLVNDGLVDTPNERQLPDKAFAIARLLDDVLPSRPSVEPAGLLAMAREAAGEAHAYLHGRSGARFTDCPNEPCPARRALLPTQASDSPEKPEGGRP